MRSSIWRAPTAAASMSQAAAPEPSSRNAASDLTLVTKSLNSTLSNRPWRDVDASVAPGSGEDKGLGKRSLLNKYSVLALSRPIVDDHADEWTEEDILQRSKTIAATIAAAWPAG
jgi:hypothetical protein